MCGINILQQEFALKIQVGLCTREGGGAFAGQYGIRQKISKPQECSRLYMLPENLLKTTRLELESSKKVLPFRYLQKITRTRTQH